MSEQSADELRLRATEAQMRRALGLGGSSRAGAQHAHSTAPTTAHLHRHHFVRDGDVPVSVVHQDGGTNKIEAARQALREQIEAREQIERQLADARTAIQALETKLAHEGIAREEAVRHAEAGKSEIEQALQVTREELAAERQARHQAEEQRDKAIADRQEAERRLREFIAAPMAREASTGPASRGRARKATKADATDRISVQDRAVSNITPPIAKGRGRSPKVREAEPEFVEWWKPRWRDRFR